MSPVLAVIAGIAAGALAFLPLYGGLRLARRATQATYIGQMGACLLGVFASFIVLFISAILIVLFARPVVLPFVLAEAITLCAVAICYGVRKMLR